MFQTYINMQEYIKSYFKASKMEWFSKLMNTYLECSCKMNLIIYCYDWLDRLLWVYKSNLFPFNANKTELFILFWNSISTKK